MSEEGLGQNRLTFKQEIMIARDHHLVRVGQCPQPMIKRTDFAKLTALGNVTRVEQNIAFGHLDLPVLAVSV